MILDKGGVAIEDTLLFGKYHLHRVLGTGRAGTVFLAVHKELEEYRAIKRVPKSFTDYQRFRQEALILKSIRHPGIPIVYDVEEDEVYSYLIEEYLEGESLFSLVSRLGHLTKAMTVRYGIQICHLVERLHSAVPNPILHLDLQPKNLLLCREQIKLVDFDHSLTLEEANVPGDRYGARGWAAPEQYDPLAGLNEQTDIYAIGAVLYYLLTGGCPEPDFSPPRRMDRTLSGIFKRCLRERPEERYGSVKELRQELDAVREKITGVFLNQSLSSLRLAIAGCKAGIGATHLAVGMTDYLRRNGFPTLYEERNSARAVAGLADSFLAARDQYGLVQIKGNWMKPRYGDNVALEGPPHSRRLLDFGTDWAGALAEDADGIFLVCDGKWWSGEANARAVEALIHHKRLCLVYNHCCPSAAIPRPQGICAEQCYRMPHFPDPFAGNADSDVFYRAILQFITKGGAEEWRRGKRAGWWGNIPQARKKS